MANKSTRQTRKSSSSRSGRTTSNKAGNYCQRLFAGRLDKYQTLRAWHGGVAILLLAQVILLLVLANTHYLSLDIEYLSQNLITDQLETATRTIAEVSVVWLLVATLAIGIVMNALLASTLFKRYQLTLEANRNRFRWLDYSLSRGLLLVIIGILLGISNLALLFAIFAVVLIQGMYSVLIDSLFKKLNRRSLRLSRVVTWMAILAPWAVFIFYVVGSWLYNSGSIPIYVYGVIATALVYFLLYDFNFIRQRLGRGRWGDYMFGEKVYLITSLIFQSAIVWQIFAGLLV